MASYVFVVALLALVSLASATPNDLLIGAFQPGEQLILREKVQEDASVIGAKVETTRTFSTMSGLRITRIRALDQHTNDHGATATLVAGGLGEGHVTLKFESQRFRAIDFIVELYGK